MSTTETTSGQPSETSASIGKLAEMIKDIRIAMLTTIDTDGVLRSRPMATQEKSFDGSLWFFTKVASGKVQSIEADQHVNVAYSDPESERYVSIAGRARLVRDRAQIEALWRPELKTWFPDGKEDPQIALICIEVDSSEYWDASSGRLVELAGFAKSLLNSKEQSH